MAKPYNHHLPQRRQVVHPISFLICGSVIGSFLNVVIYRVPRGQSVILPRSFCPQCRHPLRVGDLIPLLSYIVNRGHCRYCQSSIAWHYPLTKLVVGALFVVLSYTTTSWGEFTSWTSFFSLLWALSVIDIEHMVLPNGIVLTGILAGLVFSIIGWSSQPSTMALMGLFVGVAIISTISYISRGGMGMGDAKLLGMIGVYLGPIACLYTLFLGSIVGVVVAVSLHILRGRDRRQPIPFGPFLAVAAAMVWYWGY